MLDTRWPDIFEQAESHIWRGFIEPLNNQLRIIELVNGKAECQKKQRFKQKEYNHNNYMDFYGRTMPEPQTKPPKDERM